MKEDKIFVDTNVLVYAFDISAGIKHEKAKEIVENCWRLENGIISSQVMEEFYVCLTKKIPVPIDSNIVKQIIKDFLKWKTVVIGGDIILEAIDIHERYKYSFWDSMIIASALKGGANIIFSEDFSNKQAINGTVIKNPFE
ncbi:MAG: PIN domain-containing protein [bacterium]